MSALTYPARPSHVQVAIVAAAVYFGRGDLRSRTAALETESNRSKAPKPDRDPDAQAED